MKIKQEDIYEDFYKDKDLHDFNNYPEDSKFYDPSDRNKIGKIKDESKGKIIIEFVGLKSKMYSLIDVDGKENKKEKIVKSVVAENIKNKKHCSVLINNRIMKHTLKRTRIELHKIGTYEVCKISLSGFHDKIYMLDDGICLYNKSNSSSSVFNILHLFVNLNLNLNFSIPFIIFFTLFSSFFNILSSVSNFFFVYTFFILVFFPNSLFPPCLLHQIFLFFYLLLFLYYLFYFCPCLLGLVLIFLYLLSHFLYHFLYFLFFIFFRKISCLYILYQILHHLVSLTNNMFFSHQVFLQYHLFYLFYYLVVLNWLTFQFHNSSFLLSLTFFMYMVKEDGIDKNCLILFISFALLLKTLITLQGPLRKKSYLSFNDNAFKFIFFLCN